MVELNPYPTLAELLGVSSTIALVIVVVISVWSLIWKGLALWKSSQKKSIPWFIILLVFNTVGLLEILYIFVLSKIDFKKLFGGRKKKGEKKEEKKKGM